MLLLVLLFLLVLQIVVVHIGVMTSVVTLGMIGVELVVHHLLFALPIAVVALVTLCWRSLATASPAPPSRWQHYRDRDGRDLPFCAMRVPPPPTFAKTGRDATLETRRGALRVQGPEGVREE